MECPECGQPEGQCYRICPTQDPYHGDQAAENADYEFNAQYDDVRERYAATAEDADYINQGETGAEQELRRAVIDSLDDYADDDDVHDSFRPNDDGTVTYISPAGGEHTYDPADVFKDTSDDIPF